MLNEHRLQSRRRLGQRSCYGSAGSQRARPSLRVAVGLARLRPNGEVPCPCLQL
jgi:hypothetical protein